MKRKAVIYTLIITLSLLVGCSGRKTKTPESSSAAESVTHSAAADNAGTNTVPNQTGTASNHTETTQNTDGEATLSEEEAKQIALSHAGLTAEQVTFVKSHIEKENGKNRYEIEFFTSDNKEYDYEIDPYTGEILNFDYEAENHSVSSNTTAGETISESEAKKIVLEHVPGATEEHIKEFKTDHGNGRVQYEGEIHYEKKEYDFEIDAHSGEILEWDVEDIHD